MADLYNLKIFRLNRIKYEELWTDATNYIKATYNDNGLAYNTSSPFSQLLSVLLHLGRMIFYYIEDSITGLNIRTAYRPDQIKGLATLAGHDPGRPISSRASVRITYYSDGANDYEGQICYITNKAALKCSIIDYNYILLLGADNAKMTMSTGNYIDATIVQGTLKYQQATSDGTALQSFNFSERNYNNVDQYFVNIYVNGVKWETVSSLLDLGYNQEGCVVKTGFLGGIDVFFGNSDMGAIPAQGAIILAEYIVSAGFIGNLPKDILNKGDYWEWTDSGYLADGTELDLNSLFKVTLNTDAIFGTNGETTTLTQQIAPYTSRSMVLANELNYKYFLKKMNMFSVVEVISGYNTYSDQQATLNYAAAYADYVTKSTNYSQAVSTYGEDSTQAKSIYADIQTSLVSLKTAKAAVDDAALDDNTIYLMLVPNVANRISSAANYYTCDMSAFTLSDTEKANILQIIDQSGQKVLTIENKILEPKQPKFAINATIKMWSEYEFETVYNDCITALSDFFIGMTRRDLLPVSDIVALLENVAGIDSVKVEFAADVENSKLYNESGFYGIDEYGDVILNRTVTDTNGNTRQINDLYPLFRGGFTSSDGIAYGDTQTSSGLSGFNLVLAGYSYNNNYSTDNLKALT